MEEKILETKNGKYYSLFWKGEQNNNIAIIYYHGLNGKTKIVKPLYEQVKQYDFYSVEERGHIDSFQKPSNSPKKHDLDIFHVVQHLKTKYKKIYLCGESMGGLFITRYAYKWGNVDGVFAWSIPFYPKDIMTERRMKRFIISMRVLTCFLFGINYKYSAKVDYPKLTNSKFLMKLNEMDTQTVGSTAEELAIWKGSIGMKRKMFHKKPKCPVYYWQGEEDIMSNQKIIKKIQKKNLIFAQIIPDAKHILMFETNAKIMYDKINEVINSNNSKN